MAECFLEGNGYTEGGIIEVKSQDLFPVGYCYSMGITTEVYGGGVVYDGTEENG